MTVLFQQIINAGSPSIVPESIYASIVASNIGAFITPIGSLAGLMWMSLLKTYNVKFFVSKIYSLWPHHWYPEHCVRIDRVVY